MPGRVLIIDDEEKIRTLLARIIGLEGFEVLQAADGRSGIKKVSASAPDVVLCDVRLPDMSGFDLLQQLKAGGSAAEVILLTAYGTIPDSVAAIKNGAFDYITKGDDNNRIIPLLYQALEKARLARRVSQLEDQLVKKYSFDHIIGQAPAIKAAIAAAAKVAATDATVLLTGPTGTGKEVFAQAIHNAGSRKKQQFIAVNCAAFSKELLENELFGHKAGAFTGALKDTKGIFEEADRGTVFLDEIGEMPPDLQAKLLRVLETGELLKVGDNKATRVDVRIIAATNRDLQQEVAAGQFREDLYYRVSVFQIGLPPLRERISDIAALAEHFLRIFAHKTNKRVNAWTPAYLEALQRHDWKGNIRELRNVIERSVILSEGALLETDSLPPIMLQQTKERADAGGLDLATAEQLHIRKVLQYAGGNKTETARLLQIALTTLYRKLDEYGIK